MDQATTFEEFRDACSFSGLPGENMIWADKNGTIGWQSVGLSPVRFGWDGSLPIPGDGTYEWQGYVPIKSMPNVTNPKAGWYGTANNNNVQVGYPNIFSDFYSEPARVYRLREVMAKATNHSIQDSMALQYDTKAMNAEIVTPFIKSLRVPNNLKKAQKLLSSWNHRMDRDSAAASIYDLWEQAMLDALDKRLIPADKQKMVSKISRRKLTEWIASSSVFAFGDTPSETRDAMMTSALDAAVRVLNNRFGSDMTQWQYGNIHYAEMIHPLSHLMDADMQKQINIPALPRGGAGNTLNANHGDDRQRSGANFRMIVDTADWDTTVGTNGSGQSGDPKRHHDTDLFENWNKGDYFPMYFSKDKIKSNAGSILVLNPKKSVL